MSGDSEIGFGCQAREEYVDPCRDSLHSSFDSHQSVSLVLPFLENIKLF